jgi:hypothetical protein
MRPDTDHFKALSEALFEARHDLQVAIAVAQAHGYQRAPGFVCEMAKVLADAELAWAREGERLRQQLRQRVIHILYYRTEGQNVIARDVFYGPGIRLLTANLVYTTGQRPPLVLDDLA